MATIHTPLSLNPHAVAAAYELVNNVGATAAIMCIAESLRITRRVGNY